MKIKYLHIALVAFLLASPAKSQERPVAPFSAGCVCPFEYGCKFTKWVAQTKVPAYKNYLDSVTIAFWMMPGDSLTFNYGNMLIEQLGIAVVNRDTEQFLKGDTLIILSYSGEGIYDVWYKGKTLDVEAFWNTVDSDYVAPNFETKVALTPAQIESIWGARLVSHPRMTWWVNLSNHRGEAGWFPIPNLCPEDGACFDSPFKYHTIGQPDE